MEKYIDIVRIINYNIRIANKGGENMNEKDKKDIRELVSTAKYLADNDPQGLMLAKNTIDVLKARADLEKVKEVS